MIDHAGIVASDFEVSRAYIAMPNTALQPTGYSGLHLLPPSTELVG